jgi:hypothetical protein
MIGSSLQMFCLLLTLSGASFAPVPNLVAHWKNPHAKKADPYSVIIKRDATDGLSFEKPKRGHEDGCVMGTCMENATALGNDGVLTAPMHIPVHEHRAY